MKEILLTEYWKFFGSHSFSKGSKVCFFDNGSFAVSSDSVVKVYNAECKELKSFENARAFETGYVAVIETNGAIKIYSAFTDDFVALLDTCDGNDYMRCTDHAFITRNAETGSLFLYRPGNEDLSMQLPYNRVLDFKTTLGGMLYLCAEREDVVDMRKSKRLFDKFGEPIRCEATAQVTFLKCGSYIVVDSQGCNLYNDKNQKILHSDADFGIRDLGGYNVCFEDALVVDAKHGRIIRAIQPNEQVVTPYLMSISPYKLSGRDGFGFWLESHGMEIYPIGDNYLIGYWHDGKFYFIADSIVSQSQSGQLFSLYDITEELELYKDTISSMIPLRR